MDLICSNPMNGLLRTLCIFGAFLLGAVFTQMAGLAFLIRYMVTLMLFFAFLTMPLSGNPVRGKHFWILLCNLALGVIPYFIIRPFSIDYALIAFMTGITPTAIAAPVIISLIHRDISFVATSVLITNVAVALLIPFTLPFLVGESLQIDLASMLIEVVVVMIGPLAAAFSLRFGLPRLALKVIKFNSISFYVWIWVIWITVAKTTVYLKSQDTTSMGQLLSVATISFSLCLIGFALGYLLGGKKLNRECSQALGQKNAMLSVWICLTYLNPFIAMGPTFYILFHHLYNGWLILRYSEKKT